MKRSIYIIAVVLLLPLGTSAQKIEEYSSKLQMRFGFGATVSATKLFDNSRITDYALGYKSNYAYGQLLNISYFPWKRFGFEFNARHPLAYVGNFDKRVEAAYPGYLLLEKDSNESVANADYDLLLVYRYEKNRFYIYPKLSVGAVIICSKRFAYTFKMENSNELYQVIYKKSTPRASLSLGTSVSTGYKLSRRVFLNFDISAAYFRPKFTINQETVRLSTGDTTIDSYKYGRKNMFAFHFGAGVIVVLKNSK